MFVIRSIILLLIAQNGYNVHSLSKIHDDHDLFIEPLELVLNSTDTDGVFYCNSRVEINKQRNKLVATIENSVLTTPKFRLKTEQRNSTTIRIHISPNGYIGINRIICHWDNNVTYGQPADLIIGEKPGVIQLKERCRAYDRRYVQCTFRAPIIARAFRNGFPRLYVFSELNYETLSYRHPPVLVNITEDNELVFHFEPRDRNIIPKKIPMVVNMTLSRLGSSVYHFNVEPEHTTEVNFRIEHISNKKLKIHIDHNNTGTINQRLCSGHVSRVDDQKTLTAVQDITETSDQKITIERLHPSTEYRICLRCYYEQTDQSFKDEKCNIVKTTTIFLRAFVIAGIVAVTVIIIAVLTFTFIKCNKRKPSTTTSLKATRKVKRTNDYNAIVLSPEREGSQTSIHVGPPPITYNYEENQNEPFIVHRHSLSMTDTETADFDETDQSHNAKYQRMEDFMERMKDKRKVSPDTIDLSRQQNG